MEEIQGPGGIRVPQPKPKKQTPRRSGRGLREGRRLRWSSQDLAYIAVFAALIAVSAAVPAIPAGNVLGVPLTIQTLLVILTGLALGAWRAGAALALYVLLGVIGLPIFSSFRGGPGILITAGAGYIVGFIGGALVAGIVAQFLLRRRLPTIAALFTAAVAGTVVIHVAGIIGMMINGNLSIEAAALIDLVFVPGDLLKCVLAVVLVLPLHRAFPDLMIRRRPGNLPDLKQ
ncbi:biotin transporter BioY [Specibacter sp. NPDC078709]|uniref:biotin transporter BioY n=1 Tax=Specibacter sp. NPDC078709 TaxID=3154364 RepID=UPI003444C997